MGELWSSAGEDGRDPRLALFASGGALDGAPPSGRVLGLLEDLALPSGPDGAPFAGATWDEAAGMLAGVQALEGHVAGLKLALVREFIRRHAPDNPDTRDNVSIGDKPDATGVSNSTGAPDTTGVQDRPGTPGGGLPDPRSWGIGVQHEIAAILRISWQAAWPVADLAWQLEARLPGVGELLDAGVLSWLTAKIIVEEFSVLEGEKLAEAEKRLLEHDLAADGMTPGAIRKLCQRLADTVDPEGAARRRERKERDEARVRFFRGHGGAGALFAAGLPPDEALKSEANVQKRALEYKAAGIREKMDFLRVLALVDLTNGVASPTRLVLWQAEQAERQQSGAEDPGRRAWEDEQAEDAARLRDDPGNVSRTSRDRDGDGGAPDDRDARKAGPGDGWSGDEGPGGEGGGNGPGGAVAVSAPAGASDPGLPALVNMTCPLATVLGQADRPGEVAGYGSLDPALVRRLAAEAARSARSEFCVTFTDEHGHAAAHGCARPIRGSGSGSGNGTGNGSRTGIKAGTRVGPPGGSSGNGGNGRDGGNRGNGPPGTGWGFARDTARPGPEGGYGSWVLALPGGAQSGGRRYRVEMHKIPLHDCDHQYATGAYRPGALLRHLVQVRDGECTFPGCSRPARESDFDHAVPYHKGGATDACNAGMRSRRCHQVKQSPGWDVTQPEPGWHTWTAPSGRDYTKGPKDYPA